MSDSSVIFFWSVGPLQRVLQLGAAQHYLAPGTYAKYEIPNMALVTLNSWQAFLH